MPPRREPKSAKAVSGDWPRLSPIDPGSKIKIRDRDATPSDEVPRGAAADEAMAEIMLRLITQQAALYAEGRQALLVVLQARDAGGKDGTIRRVFGPFNSQGCVVTSFKRPTELELAHDYLWRIHQAVPPRGTIGVFNRSHYEDVLVVRVHQLVDRSVWSKRYDQINEFERILSDNGVTILKLFLHISREEQKERLQERLSDPDKNWKFQLGDLKERDLWDEYTEAYEDMIEKCSTAWAPWHLVPADRKSSRDLLVSELLLATLDRMNPQFPRADPKVLEAAKTLR